MCLIAFSLSYYSVNITRQQHSIAGFTVVGQLILKSGQQAEGILISIQLKDSICFCIEYVAVDSGTNADIQQTFIVPLDSRFVFSLIGANIASLA